MRNSIYVNSHAKKILTLKRRRDIYFWSINAESILQNIFPDSIIKIAYYNDI